MIPRLTSPEPAATDYDFAADAAAVPLLRDWTLDGVLINVDDDVLDVETPHDARNDGLLLNVAIAGPTPMRNAARGVGARTSNQLLPRNAWTPQVVDDTPMALDCIVALLVGDPVMLNAGDDPSDLNRPRYYRFHWQLGSLRQWYNITAGGNGGGFAPACRVTTWRTTGALTGLVASPIATSWRSRTKTASSCST